MIVRGISIVLATLGLTACAGSGATDTDWPRLPAGTDPLVIELIEVKRDEVEARPDRATAIGELGRVYHANKLFELAAACYVVAADDRPDEPEWPYLLGVLHVQRGRSHQAVEFLEHAIRIEPANVAARIHLGQALIDDGETAAADEQFSRVVELEPDSPWGLLGRARVARADGRAADAVLLLEHAVALEPELREAHHLLAQAYREAGRAAEAEQALLRFAATTRAPRPRDPRIEALAQWEAGHQVLARSAAAALEAGRYTEAESLYNRALAARPDDYATLVNLGLLHVRQDRLAEAQGLFARAVGLEPGNPHARYALAMCLASSAKRAEARRELDHVLRLDPDHAGARSLAQRLSRGSAP